MPLQDALLPGAATNLPPAPSTPGLPVVPPTKYLEHPGPAPLTYNVWHTLFCRFVYQIDRARPLDNQLTDEDKNTYLFSLLGSEGVRQFAANPAYSRLETAPHADFAAAVKQHFSRKPHLARAHFDFHKRDQSRGETIQEYLTDLRVLAADCDLKNNEDFFIAIQLACGARDKEAQRKLLSTSPVDLATFTAIIEAEESAKSSAAAIRGESVSVNIAQTREPPAASGGRG